MVNEICRDTRYISKTALTSNLNKRLERITRLTTYKYLKYV